VIIIKEWLVNVVQSNKINVVGLGPGNIKYLSTAGIDCIKEAEIVVGSTRQLSDLKAIISEKQEIYILGKLAELIAYLKENIEKKITIIVSGDTGYYSLVPYLSKNLSKDILNIIPNISSYQYLFSKMGENWQNFRLASVHGREFDYVKNIDDKDIAGLVLLTDDIQNPYEVSKNLYNNGIRNLTVIVGENLSYDNEKNKLKIIFLDRNTVGPFELKEIFSKYGEYIEFNLTNDDDIASYLKDYDVVILNRIRLGKKEFEKAPHLKLVLLTGTGFNHIDLVAAKEHEVSIANVAGYSTNSVSQLTMTFLLNELTKVEKLSQKVKEKKWNELSINMDEYYHVDTEDKILGILGYGNIGQKVAEYAESFGMKVMVAKIPGREYTDSSDNRYDLDEVLERCDVLSIHAPLTDITKDLINLDRMKKMKKSAIILNLGRGPIINEEDLYYALKNNIIASAATDVMTTEPPKNDCKLLELDNFTVTPHLAWKSQKSLERLFTAIENNLNLFLENKLIGVESK